MSWYIFSPRKALVLIEQINLGRQVKGKVGGTLLGGFLFSIWLSEKRKSRVCVYICLCVRERVRVSCNALYEELDSWEVIWRSPLLTRLLGFHFPFPLVWTPIQFKRNTFSDKVKSHTHIDQQEDWKYKKVAFFVGINLHSEYYTFLYWSMFSLSLSLFFIMTWNKMYVQRNGPWKIAGNDHCIK